MDVYTNIFLRFPISGAWNHLSTPSPGVVWMPPAQHRAIRTQGRESHFRGAQEHHLQAEMSKYLWKMLIYSGFTL